MMIAFEMQEWLDAHAASGERWLETFRAPAESLSIGIYRLDAGATDGQTPHSEDEVYYILQGRGKIYVAGEDREVQPGSIIFVAAHDEHHFHSISEALTILVIFAPGEYTKSRG